MFCNFVQIWLNISASIIEISSFYINHMGLYHQVVLLFTISSNSNNRCRSGSKQIWLHGASDSVLTDPARKWGKKCSPGQRFICTKVTSYKIHTYFSRQYKRIVGCGCPASALPLAQLIGSLFVAISSIFWLHCADSIKELTLESNGRRWLSRVSVSSSSGPSGLSKELEHKTEEEKENCQANEKPNNGGYGRLSKGTRRICNKWILTMISFF